MNSNSNIEVLRSTLTDAVLHAEEGKPFVLKSGATSDWYLDARPVTFGKLNLVGASVQEKLYDEGISVESYDAIGGPALGAIPIASAVGARTNRRTFTVRPEPKDHGLESLVVGDLRKGDRVVIVEDTVTSGGSMLKAVAEVSKAGAIVVAVLCLLYRGEGEIPSHIEMPKIDKVNGAQGDKVPFIHLFTPADLGVS